MSHRDIRRAAETGPCALFATARGYAAELLRRKQPARAILTLCRAIYIDPQQLPPGTRQPFEAYRWILDHAHAGGFLGNPRISFHHQATRIRENFPLKRMRAWALWHITREACPDLPPDPRDNESPPPAETVSAYLDRHGLPGEGAHFLEVLAAGSGSGLGGLDGSSPTL